MNVDGICPMFAASVDASGCADGGLGDGLESDGAGLFEAGELVAGELVVEEVPTLEGGAVPSTVQPHSTRQIPVAARLRIHTIIHPLKERTFIP